MAQAQGTDFASYAQLSESEQEVLEQALASIPDDILSTGDRPAIESRIRNRLQREGFLTEGPLGMGEVPAVAFVGRAVACLAAKSSSLRSINQNKPAGSVAEAIARSVQECSSGKIEDIKADILKHRQQVASSLAALGLPSLGDALLKGRQFRDEFGEIVDPGV